MSVSVCVYVSVCLSVCLTVSVSLFVRYHISGTIHVRSLPIFLCVLPVAVASVLLWRRSDALRTSGFVDDVIFAHTLISCSTSSPGCGSEAHMYAALSLVRRNTRCRQRTLGTTSCSQGLLAAVGVLNIFDIVLARNVRAYIATRK